MINIGDIIKEHCRLNKISVYSLASRLNLTPPVLYKAIRLNNFTVARLDQISKALSHNFFVYFVQNTGTSEENSLKLSNENKELKVKVASLQKEIAYLQEINSLLKASLP